LRRTGARRPSPGARRAPRQIFLSACLFAIVAAIATGLLFLRGNREMAADRPATVTP
jgi:hypothetical protein